MNDSSSPKLNKKEKKYHTEEMSSVTILRWARMHLLPYARASHAHPVIILPLGGVGGSAASHLKAGDSILLPAAARRRRGGAGVRFSCVRGVGGL